MKLGFVHIPKTAGTAIREALRRTDKHTCVYAGGYHDRYSDFKQRFAGCDKVIAFVRNPYDRHISQCEEELAFFAKNKHGPFRKPFAMTKAYGYEGVMQLSRAEWGQYGREKAYYPWACQYEYISDKEGVIYPNVTVFKIDANAEGKEKYGGLKALESLLGVKVLVKNKSHLSKKQTLNTAEFLLHAPLLKATINSHYAEDFERFNYEIL